MDADTARGTLPRRPPSRRRQAGEATVAALASAVIVLPDLVRLDRWTPFAQLGAFRPVWAACALLLGVLAVLTRRLRLVGGALALVALVGIALVAPRAHDGSTPTPAAPDPLTVLSANVSGSADVARLARIVRAEQPGVVILPEADEQFRQHLEKALRGQGYHGMSRQSLDTTVAAMSILVSPRLGDLRFRAESRTTFPTIIATGGTLNGTRIVAFHASPPLPLATADWRNDLSSLSRWCDEGRPTLVAGDFNATLDHSVLRTAMRGCTDAAATLGVGLRGTWLSRYPAWLTPQIDHVLTTSEIEPKKVSFIRLEGSDHRAILARVELPRPGPRGTR